MEAWDASRCGHEAFQSKDPVVEGGTWKCLVRQWREMNELCLSWVWGLFVNNLGWSEEEHRHLKRNIHQAAMKM